MTAFAALWWRYTIGEAARVHDEYAYLLQARIFLDGHLSWPRPPLAEFFQAPHVFIEPVYASKYFPGQPLLILPFLALGVPWLGPCLAMGLTAALAYYFLREARTTRVAALTGVVAFMFSHAATMWGASYLSHSGAILGTAVVLVGLQRLLRTGSVASSSLCAAGVAYVALCRPLTGVALGVVLAVVLIVLLKRRSLNPRALPVIMAMALGTAAAAAAYSSAITGHWNLTPWALWAKQYAPFDGLGLGALGYVEAPLLPVPEHFEPLLSEYLDRREAYVPAALPGVALERLVELTNETLPSSAFILLVWLGVVVSFRRRHFALVSMTLALYAASQFAFHSTLPQYLSDLAFPMALLVGAGAQFLIGLGGAGTKPAKHLSFAIATLLAVSMLYPEMGWPFVASWAAATATLGWLWRANHGGKPAMAIVLYLLALSLVDHQVEFDVTKRRDSATVDRQPFLEARERVKKQRGILFVRHGGDATKLPFDLTLATRELDEAPVIVAVDLGARNAELVSLLERTAWLYDAATETVSPWPAPEGPDAGTALRPAP